MQKKEFIKQPTRTLVTCIQNSGKDFSYYMSAEQSVSVKYRGSLIESQEIHLLNVTKYFHSGTLVMACIFFGHPNFAKTRSGEGCLLIGVRPHNLILESLVV
jgi:hypothetical protein